MTYTSETLRALADSLDNSMSGAGIGRVKTMEAEAMRSHADAWEAEQNEDIRRHEEWLNERNGLLERLEVAERLTQLVCETTDSHYPDCPQFTGPYDLGELEPACTCWKRTDLTAGESET